MQTIPQLFLQQVASKPHVDAIYLKSDVRFRPLTWQDVHYDVRRYVARLLEIGVARGDRVVQFSENRYEWILADLALHIMGAIHVPVHSTLSGPQVIEQAIDSGARVMLVASDGLAKLLANSRLPLPEGVQVYSYEPVLVKLHGRSIELFPRVEIDTAAAKICEARLDGESQLDDVATILYTSGTTGEPKGVMLSQRNLATNATQANLVIGQEPSDLRLNLLPLSHIYARTCDLYGWVVGGNKLALASSKDSAIADACLVRPMVMNAVPYFYGRLQKYLIDQGQGQQPGALRELLGGRVRFCCSGGAPLPPSLYDFFQSQDVPLLQGYGLTESSPVISVSSLAVDRRGAVGRPIPGVEVRIADDGEILTRGPHVMVGYWQNQTATVEIIRDGWLHTGDLGRLDEDMFLFITGRKKELIVTATGKNIAPTYLEALLTEDSLIQAAMIVGDNRKYLSALIVPDRPSLEKELGQELADNELNSDLVVNLLLERISKCHEDLAHYEQVRKIFVLSRAFSVEAQEVTAKLSLRREVIAAHFASEIEALYQ